MRLTWEIVIAILTGVMSVFLMWFVLNDSAVVVAKGGSEALYGIKTAGINEFAIRLATIVN